MAKLSPDVAHLLASAFNQATTICHHASAAAGWWSDPITSEFRPRNPGEMLALIHSEISEALEGVRKNAMDDHLPHRRMEEVEMADALIRIFDYCGGRGLDLAGAFIEKLEYNKTRADHTLEARNAVGGKAF